MRSNTVVRDAVEGGLGAPWSMDLEILGSYSRHGCAYGGSIVLEDLELGIRENL
jgi:hypothetical protein